MKVEVLKNMIIGVQTAIPVSIELVSKPTNMRVTTNPFKDAVKCVTISGMIGMSYSNGVNNQLGREDKDMDFEVQRPVWMKPAGNNLGTNSAGDRFYVPVKVQSSSTPVYLLDDIDVTVEVQPFLRKASKPKTQAKLDKEVVWRTPALDNIHKIRMLGAEHTIEG